MPRDPEDARKQAAALKSQRTSGASSASLSFSNVAQTVGEVALPLAAKPGNAMQRNGLQQIGGEIQALQEFQAMDLKSLEISGTAHE